MKIEIENLIFENIEEMCSMKDTLSNDNYKLPYTCTIKDLNGWEIHIGSDLGNYDGTWIQGPSIGSENLSNIDEAYRVLNELTRSKYERYNVRPYSEMFMEFVEDVKRILPKYHSTYGIGGKGGMYTGSFISPAEHLHGV